MRYLCVVIIFINRGLHKAAFSTYSHGKLAFLSFNVNTLTANYEYSSSNRENLRLPIQMQLLEKLKTFSAFFITFLEFTSNFEHFEKKLSLIAQVFLKLLTPKDALT